jgi:signal transduction histidine kinase
MMPAEMMANASPLLPSWPQLVHAGLAFVGGVIVFAALLFWGVRKYLRGREREKPRGEFEPPSPRTANQEAFMAASMQGVIQRLSEQERELERLHRAERERAQQTARLTEAVTRHMPTGLLLVNSAGLITVGNPAAERALGLGALAYRRFSDILGEQAGLSILLGECLRTGKTFRREEIEHTTPAGELRTLGVTISAIPPPPDSRPPGARPHGAPSTGGAVVLLSDLTELTALQRQMQMKENLAALGEMAAGIAHEFKNALATIGGYAQLLQGGGDPAEVADNARRILEETRALAHVVTEFLRFARPLEYEPGAVPLGPLVERVVEEVREAAPGVEIVVVGSYGEVSGDEGLLRQALLNLLRNAAEAVAGRSGARIEITGGAPAAGASGPGEQTITVADNGPGIPAEALGKLFLPFFTTKAQGNGLGLAIVQKVALQHGGTVAARNRPEGGASFTLSLPVRRTLSAPAVESAPARI